MTPNEQVKYEPQLDTNEEESDLEIPPATKQPRSADAYKSDYRYVLPNRKIISDFKHKKSLHEEMQATQALASKKDTRITLHYETTLRSRVDGE